MEERPTTAGEVRATISRRHLWPHDPEAWPVPRRAGGTHPCAHDAPFSRRFSSARTAAMSASRASSIAFRVVGISPLLW